MTIDRRLLLTLFATLAVGAAIADDDHRENHDKRERHEKNEWQLKGGKHELDEMFDHRAADAARRAGEIRPLREILEAVEAQHPGEVVGVLFGREDGIWIYEIKVLTPSGRYVEVYVDARTKKVIKTEGN